MRNGKDVPWYSGESGLFGDIYFRIFGHTITEEGTTREVNFVEKVLDLKPGAKIFDMCCGHGRHSLELAKRGYNVTGQDLSSNFLKIAEESAAKAGVSVRWIHSDMRNVDFENEFDAAIFMFTSFGVLESDDENQKVLNGIARSLKKGGKFIIDAANRDKIIRQYLFRDHKYYDDGTMEIIDRKFDHVSGYHNEKRKLFFPGGSVKEFSIILRFYTVPELKEMLSKAGLNIIDSYGDFDFIPISFSSPNYILIAEKS
ncbi:MAG TPA: methyltransferase domain-containing protein [Ignavibacteria bacterium]|jgi:ubiquinone/menaquinone biosynthesis C-methylase UbiE